MFLPFLAWTGGIVVGARVAGGLVRGAGELVRGHPAAAVCEVADGLVEPLRMAFQEIGKLGGEILVAVLGNGEPVEPFEPEPAPPASGAARRRRRPKLAIAPSDNGVVD